MRLMHLRMHGRTLGFPNECDIALPESALAGERCAMILCLHDLGANREMFALDSRLRALVDALHVALVMPDGRRSCFLNMAHGPKWGDYVCRELPDQLSRLLPLNRKTGCVGVGAGALGALQAARRGVPCALIAPIISDIDGYRRHPDTAVRWPIEGEWKGVFEGREADWQPGGWLESEGLIICEEKVMRALGERLSLAHWKLFTQSAALEISCAEAISFLARRLKNA